MLSGRYGQAIAPLEKAIRFKPDYPDAFVNLGASLNRMRRFGETVALLEDKLDRWGSRPDLRFNLGVAYAYLGNRAAAQRQLAALYRLDPRMAQTLANLLR